MTKPQSDRCEACFAAKHRWTASTSARKVSVRWQPKAVVEQIKLLETNNIWIKKLVLTGERREQAERQFSKGLTYDDARLVRENVPRLHALAPLKLVDADIRFEGRQTVAQVVGTVLFPTRRAAQLNPVQALRLE